MNNSISPWNHWHLLLDTRLLTDLQQSPFHSAPSLLHLHSSPLIHLCSISIPPLTLLHSSLFSPCFILCPCLPVSLISIPMLPWSSHLLHIVSYPIPSSPCFTLVPLFLVPGWVKLNLQHSLLNSSPLLYSSLVWIFINPHLSSSSLPLWLGSLLPTLVWHLWPNSDHLCPILCPPPLVKFRTQMFRKGAQHISWSQVCLTLDVRFLHFYQVSHLSQ